MDPRVEFDGDARFRIVVGNLVGQYTDYRGIASLTVDSTVYIAVSEYFAGSCGLEPEKVYKATLA